MKSLIVAASAIAMIASTPAFAADGEILLSATVSPACGVGNHSRAGNTPAVGFNDADISVTLADANGKFAGAEFTDRTFGNVWCNNAASVTLAVAPLTSTATSGDTGSFTNRFDVRVTTDAGVYINKGENYVISTVGVTGVKEESGSTNGAFETGGGRFGGADKIEVLADSQSRRPVAGSYSGYLKFTATTS